MIKSTSMSMNRNETCQRLRTAESFGAYASNARVVEWQTRTFEGRMPKGMRVQVPPRAPNCRSIYSFANQLFDLASIAFRSRSLF
jgi:hypothetical protein